MLSLINDLKRLQDLNRRQNDRASGLQAFFGLSVVINVCVFPLKIQIFMGVDQGKCLCWSLLVSSFCYEG